jgi:hypothetical protein
MKNPVDFATGVVLHSEEKEAFLLGKDYVLYADPTDNVRVNNCQLFVAALFPQGVDETRKLLFEHSQNGDDGHLLGIKRNYNGESYTYYFGSAWSKHDVRTMEEWKARSEWTLRSLRQPLELEWMAQ